jgi:hypothetical protein
MARRPSKITEKQQTYVDSIMEGKSKDASAKAAGYPHAQHLERSETVRQEIALAREKLTDLTQIRRLDVVDGIMDGISLARMQGDAGNVIKGWTEVGKMLGHYAPEVKTLNLNLNQQRLRSKFEALSDEELLAIQNGAVIDVDSKTIN